MRSTGLIIVSCVAALMEMPVYAQEIRLRNAGFEEAGDRGPPAGWHGQASVYSRDTTVSRSGQASLKFAKNDPKGYFLCSQRIALEPGRMYEISGWVKTRGIKGADSGATICLEWSGQEGKYLGGAYPRGKKGDADWTLIKGASGRIPKEAKHCNLTCYVRKGMTGTAWWDDVRVRRVREKPLSTVLRLPNYRGEITDAGPPHVQIRAVLRLDDYDAQPKDVALGWTVVREKDRIEVNRGVLDALTSAETDIVIPVSSLTGGAYHIEVILTSKRRGSRLDGTSHRVVRLGRRTDRAAHIDAHNRLILEGQPFFPLGMYWHAINEKEIAVYAEGAFNCMMPYGAPNQAQMDLAHRHGLKVIYSVKDIYSGTRWAPKGIKTEADELTHIKQKVAAFAGHPALMAWYINDELPLSMVDRLARHRRWMEELDPNHPTWVVLYQVDQVRQYLETFDVIGTDPYPIPNKPASTAGEWMRKTVNAVTGARAVWMVPQVFNWACYKKGASADPKHRTPTFDEMRSMAWQCIAEGANGLIFYSWFDIRRDPATPFEQHWPKVKRMAQEIKDMIPALLSVEPTPAIKADPSPQVHWAVRQRGDTTYLIAVNDGPKPATARFTLPGKPKAAALRGSSEAVTLDAQGTLAAELAPLGVRIYELTGLGKR